MELPALHRLRLCCAPARTGALVPFGKCAKWADECAICMEQLVNPAAGNQMAGENLVPDEPWIQVCINAHAFHRICIRKWLFAGEDTSDECPECRAPILGDDALAKIPDGVGSKRFQNGGEYDGRWKDELEDGVGTFRWYDGNEYTGQWENGKKSGTGTFRWAGGAGEYNGQWKDDVKSGTGTFRHPDGDTYVGEWADNQKHGRGRYTFNDGGYYDGEWVASDRVGEGVRRYPNGSTHEGRWANDDRHGPGTYTSIELDYTLVGEWKDGALVGHAVKTYGNGNVYEGEWREFARDGGKLYGEGRVTTNGTLVFRGVFDASQPTSAWTEAEDDALADAYWRAWAETPDVDEAQNMLWRSVAEALAKVYPRKGFGDVFAGDPRTPAQVERRFYQLQDEERRRPAGDEGGAPTKRRRTTRDDLY